MAKRKEDFPRAFFDVLRAVRDKGELVLTFDSEEVCARERLRFYRFLASVRADSADELAEIAASCLVQWRALHGSKVRRVLKIVANGKAGNDVWAQAAVGATDSGAAEALEIDEALQRERAILKEMFKNS